MNKTRQYTYPDKKDKATYLWIEEEEPYPGYWAKSTRYLNTYLVKLLSKQGGSFLDVGCGNGHYTLFFEKYFSRLDALEPDQSRLSGLTDKLSGHPKINALHSDFLSASIPNNQYDVIFCSHVLQHISFNEIDPFTAKCNDLLKPNGILVLITTHSRSDKNIFLKSVVVEGKIVEPIIDMEEFESLINNDQGILPCALFSRNFLVDKLAAFDLLKIKVHQDLGKKTALDNMLLRNRWINLPFFRRKCGSNILIVGRKT